MVNYKNLDLDFSLLIPINLYSNQCCSYNKFSIYKIKLKYIEIAKYICYGEGMSYKGVCVNFMGM